MTPQGSTVSIKTAVLIHSLSLSGQDQGFMAGLKIPAPWTSGKNVETVHPVRDNYKFKETVHIPGARCLYLRFDPRCSSQYDYDKASAFWDKIWSVVRPAVVVYKVSHLKCSTIPNLMPPAK